MKYISILLIMMGMGVTGAFVLIRGNNQSIHFNEIDLLIITVASAFILCGVLEFLFNSQGERPVETDINIGPGQETKTLAPNYYGDWLRYKAYLRMQERRRLIEERREKENQLKNDYYY